MVATRPAPAPPARARTRPTLLAILTLVALNLAAHLPGIGDPPNGYHAWRESDTAAVAESFLRETGDILKPRIHQRWNTVGITGMEFPIYNYAVALLYRVAGFHHWVPRLLSLLIGTIGLLGIRSLARSLGMTSEEALLATFLAACAPLYFFYSRKIQPDILLPTASCWAFFLFIRG